MPRRGGIDYSKWDHFGEDDDNNDDDQGTMARPRVTRLDEPSRVTANSDGTWEIMDGAIAGNKGSAAAATAASSVSIKSRPTISTSTNNNDSHSCMTPSLSKSNNKDTYQQTESETRLQQLELGKNTTVTMEREGAATTINHGAGGCKDGIVASTDDLNPPVTVSPVSSSVTNIIPKHWTERGSMGTIDIDPLDSNNTIDSKQSNTNRKKTHVYWCQDRSSVTIRILLIANDDNDNDDRLHTIRSSYSWSCQIEPMLHYRDRYHAVGTMAAATPQFTITRQRLFHPSSVSSLLSSSKPLPLVWIQTALPHPVHAAEQDEELIDDDNNDDEYDNDVNVNINTTSDHDRDNQKTPKRTKFNRISTAVDWMIETIPAAAAAGSRSSSSITTTSDGSLEPQKFLVVTLYKAVPMMGITMWWKRPFVEYNGDDVDVTMFASTGTTGNNTNNNNQSFAQAWHQAHDEFRSNIQAKKEGTATTIGTRIDGTTTTIPKQG